MTKLTCKSCGAKLDATEKVDKFTCQYCGNEWIVKQEESVADSFIKEMNKIDEYMAGRTMFGQIPPVFGQVPQTILDLNLRKMKINRFPTKINPEYAEAMEKYHKESVENSHKFYSNPFVIAGAIISIAVAVAVFFYFPSFITYLTGEAVGNLNNNNTNTSFFCSIITGLIAFIPFLRFYKAPATIVPEQYILDEEQKKINEEELARIDSDIAKLQKNGK